MHWCLIVCVRIHGCMFVCGWVCENVIAFMPDKLFVTAYKCMLNWAAKTHILLSRPDSLPTCYSHNTQIRVLSVQSDCERRATLSWCTQESPYQALYNLVDSTAFGKRGTDRNCAFAWAQPYLWRMWMAGAGCCCAMGPWVIFSECRLLTSEEESAADEEEVLECKGGMARMGNLSVSAHMRTPASCSLGPVHLSTSVSTPLGVWHLPLLPDFKPKQLECYAHGTNPVTNTHTQAQTHTHWPFNTTQETWSSAKKTPKHMH